MRILLVGNYPLDRQVSMSRYAEMMRRELSARGHEVELIRPRPFFGKWSSKPLLRKWLGYVDKFLLFPGVLRRRSRAFELVHICDHSNAMYLRHAAERPATITCHDLLAVRAAHGRLSEQRVPATGRILQRMILTSLARASDVVCVSAATGEDLASLAPNAHRRVVEILNPLHFPYSPAPDTAVAALRQRLGLTEGDRYLLHVGSNSWFKNRPGLLRIFAGVHQLLKRENAGPLRLVMVGQRLPEVLREWIQANGLQDEIVEVNEASDEDLGVAYTGAWALLFPSLYEGFGWPVIEAQRCGCPVICSRRPPLTEVAGDAALYLEVEDEGASSRLIAENLERLPMLRELGFLNAERFLPERIIPEYETFFRAAMAAFRG
jgi:glycosyltransferase involved in cell wall biosynthesis